MVMIVTPAEAGVQKKTTWIPACAGMTAPQSCPSGTGN
jgi:hypothetical protein